MEDAQNRAEIKLKRAVEEVKKLLVPAVSNNFKISNLGVIFFFIEISRQTHCTNS